MSYACIRPRLRVTNVDFFLGKFVGGEVECRDSKQPPDPDPRDSTQGFRSHKALIRRGPWTSGLITYVDYANRERGRNVEIFKNLRQLRMTLYPMGQNQSDDFQELVNERSLRNSGPFGSRGVWCLRRTEPGQALAASCRILAGEERTQFGGLGAYPVPDPTKCIPCCLTLSTSMHHF